MRLVVALPSLGRSRARCVAGVMTTQKRPRQPSTEAKFDDDDLPRRTLTGCGAPIFVLVDAPWGAVRRNYRADRARCVDFDPPIVVLERYGPEARLPEGGDHLDGLPLWWEASLVRVPRLRTPRSGALCLPRVFLDADAATASFIVPNRSRPTIETSPLRKRSERDLAEVRRSSMRSPLLARP